MSAEGPIAFQLESVIGVIARLAFNPLVLLGLGVYSCGTFLWLVALSRVELSYAYPFASLNYVFVLVASWWVLGEQPSVMRVVGVALICVGVLIVSRTAAKTSLIDGQGPMARSNVLGGDANR
ncbi:MAG TPA: EamA family transporter [Chloroflexota bacterium]|nr:EamA family transporter [Chloroflexota bacterium]